MNRMVFALALALAFVLGLLIGSQFAVCECGTPPVQETEPGPGAELAGDMGGDAPEPGPGAELAGDMGAGAPGSGARPEPEQETDSEPQRVERPEKPTGPRPTWTVHIDKDEYTSEVTSSVWALGAELRVSVSCQGPLGQAINLSFWPPDRGRVFGSGRVDVLVDGERFEIDEFEDEDIHLYHFGSITDDLIDEMRAGSEIRIRTREFRAGYAEDRFSLVGFTAAMREAGC